MTNHVLPSALDHSITSAASGSHRRAHVAHVNRLRVSARSAFDQVNISLASIQNSLLLLAEIERSNSLRPIAEQLWGVRTEPRSPLIWWEVYPAFPKPHKTWQNRSG